MFKVKYLVIGDIHGTYRELMALLDLAAIDSDDHIIALGDILDRGPESLEVFQFFNTHANATAIMGNHEHKHILSYNGVIKPAFSQRITREQFTVSEYDGMINAIRRFPLYLDLNNALLIHGAFEPGVPVTEQNKSVLLGTRNGEAYLRKRFEKPWYDLYDQDKPVIAGHHDYSGNGTPIIKGDKVFLIDTGCCYGRNLSAILLPDFRIIQVKSSRNYWGIIKQQSNRRKVKAPRPSSTATER